ncbi:anti-sigma factor [Actinoplanes derwentensis]|uniref:Putative zinc-finger n=1 Tax=Actinoplanes derwentensis TaxID=113562 RepID=A0A1H2CQM0_9ACTN|nr:zf-HC2 domain-containing protein [Actinoplanes derwentensis]GID83848.1 anti-sigma factor [Actinoplanes derwentensis]SDT72567.1 Putative zinc-finger [Actinoplanes derwentensis]
MRCEDGHDDAAYVLGALSPIERAAYENHLATCSFCREAVADLAQVPDMLDRLDADEFERLLDPDLFSSHRPSPRPPSRPAVKKSRVLRTRIASTAVAAVLVLGIGGGVTAWAMNRDNPAGPPLGPAIAMTAVENGSPIAATVRITSTPGGSRVEMHCEYSSTGKPYTFRLIAYGPDEQREQLGSWLAQPGADFLMPAATHFAQGSLARLELVRYDGKVMLVYEPPR